MLSRHVSVYLFIHFPCESCEVSFVSDTFVDLAALRTAVEIVSGGCSEKKLEKGIALQQRHPNGRPKITTVMVANQHNLEPDTRLACSAGPAGGLLLRSESGDGNRRQEEKPKTEKETKKVISFSVLRGRGC